MYLGWCDTNMYLQIQLLCWTIQCFCVSSLWDILTLTPRSILLQELLKDQTFLYFSFFFLLSFRRESNWLGVYAIGVPKLFSSFISIIFLTCCSGESLRSSVMMALVLCSLIDFVLFFFWLSAEANFLASELTSLHVLVSRLQDD